MSIRAILVDFYDVLYGEQDPTQLREFEKTHGLKTGGVRQAMHTSTYFQGVRLGHVDGEVLWRDVAEQIGVDPEGWQTLVTIYSSAFGPNQELVAFLQAIRPHYQLALLCNATAHVRSLVTQHLQLGHLFEVIQVSAEEGVKKPEAESYRRLLRRLQVQPEEAIFVDDDLTYISAAQVLGIHGIPFTTTHQAIADIRRLLASDGAK